MTPSETIKRAIDAGELSANEAAEVLVDHLASFLSAAKSDVGMWRTMCSVMSILPQKVQAILEVRGKFQQTAGSA